MVVIGFLWEQFGPYHMDRCDATAAELKDIVAVVGIEVAPASSTYAWASPSPSALFQRSTLFPKSQAQDVSQLKLFVAILKELKRSKIKILFVSGYERGSRILLSLVAWLIGVRLIVMNDSKFDDKPRIIFKELIKALTLFPYDAAFASGERAAEYFRFLGFRKKRLVLGYDTVSVNRLRSHLGTCQPPPWDQRPFLVVARFVEKKNIGLALRAYAQYVASSPAHVRRLRLCGGGVLEADLRALAVNLGIAANVDFVGFVEGLDLSREFAEALCLLLPSKEDQWGLVVNEAIAFGLPIIATPQVGACDKLIVNLKNGFIVKGDSVETWALAMKKLAIDEGEWSRMSEASQGLCPEGDVSGFVQGVKEIMRSDD